jgi:hypothetical protein
MNVDDVVVLAVSSSRSDLIQAPQRAAPPSVAHVQRNNDSSSTVQQCLVEWSMGSAARRRGVYGGEYLQDRASPTRAR